MGWKAKPDGDRKPKKIPFYINGKPRDKTDTAADRKQLVNLDEARERFKAQKFFGLGVALGPVPGTSLILSGIDLDHSVDGADIAHNARRVIDAAHDAYCEISPGLHGLKIFGTGDIGKEKETHLEIYSGGRFFTVTGQKVEGNQLADLRDAAALARQLFKNYQKESGGPIADGARNNTLFAFARGLRARDVPEGEAWELLQRRNQDCMPPLDERELRQILHGAWKYAPSFSLTDLGNRDRLVSQHSEDLRYLIGHGWHCWTGQRFEPDDKRRVIVLMGNVARGIYAEAATENDADRRKALGTWAKNSESLARIEAAVALTQSHPAVVGRLSDYDTNPNLIGLRNGVFDLERDEFRAARRDDFITKQMEVDFDAAARCPRWEQFQLEIHGGDTTVVSFKHRLWGYTASGDTREQMFFMPFGEGANGKGTEQETMAEVFGDYALSIEPEVLAKKRHTGQNSASSDIAEMHGMRFIYTSELEEGHRLAEKLLKRLTGQDTIRARFLYQERFAFKPVGKFWISTNHRPQIRGRDHAIWRRTCLIPYLVRFEGTQIDYGLREKLLAERAGIFNWMVAGYRAWRAQGLAPPPVVREAVGQYRSDMDVVGSFLQECCQYGLDVKGRTRANVLHRAYCRWAKQSGMFPMAAQAFHEHMERDHKLMRVAGDTGAKTEYPGVLLTDPQQNGQEAWYGDTPF
jgi:putative DNA primase/helicase